MLESKDWSSKVFTGVCVCVLVAAGLYKMFSVRIDVQSLKIRSSQQGFVGFRCLDCGHRS